MTDEVARRQSSQWQCMTHFGGPSNSYSMARQEQRPFVVTGDLAMNYSLWLGARRDCLPGCGELNGVQAKEKLLSSKWFQGEVPAGQHTKLERDGHGRLAGSTEPAKRLRCKAIAAVLATAKLAKQTTHHHVRDFAAIAAFDFA